MPSHFTGTIAGNRHYSIGTIEGRLTTVCDGVAANVYRTLTRVDFSCSSFIVVAVGGIPRMRLQRMPLSQPPPTLTPPPFFLWYFLLSFRGRRCGTRCNLAAAAAAAAADEKNKLTNALLMLVIVGRCPRRVRPFPYYCCAESTAGRF